MGKRQHLMEKGASAPSLDSFMKLLGVNGFVWPAESPEASKALLPG
jgi:hypothetical protein